VIVTLFTRAAEATIDKMPSGKREPPKGHHDPMHRAIKVMAHKKQQKGSKQKEQSSAFAMNAASPTS
jgi:hypothetical protein